MEHSTASLAPNAHQSQLIPLRTSCVYRYYDAAARLIYIGVTMRGIARQREHNQLAQWWPFVARQEIEHCEDDTAARKLERELILEHRPPFNRQHNDRYEAARSAYLGLVAAEKAFAAAQAGSWSEGRPCGHCIHCLDQEMDDDGVCEVLNTGTCDVCHRPECVYPGAYSEGSMWGYTTGYDHGWELGEGKGWDEATALYAADSMATLMISAVIDGKVGKRGAFIYEIPGTAWPITPGSLAPAPTEGAPF